MSEPQLEFWRAAVALHHFSSTKAGSISCLLCDRKQAGEHPPVPMDILPELVAVSVRATT